MTIIKIQKHDRYCTVENTVVEDKRLSTKYLGTFLRLINKKNDWQISVAGLAKLYPTEGIDYYRSALKELCKFGYLIRIPQPKIKGQYQKVEMHLFEESQLDEPLSDESVKKLFQKDPLENGEIQKIYPKRIFQHGFVKEVEATQPITNIPSTKEKNSNSNPDSLNQEREEPSGKRCDVERKFVQIDVLLKEETDLSVFERRTFLNVDINELIKAIVYWKQNRESEKIFKLGGYLHNAVNKKLWEDKKVASTESQKKQFNILKHAHKCVKEHGKLYETVDICDDEICAYTGSGCVRIHVSDMSKQRYETIIDELKINLMHRCGVILESVTTDDGKTKTFKIKDM